jgi:hypothetical protein
MAMLGRIFGKRSRKPCLPALSADDALARMSSALEESQLSPVLDPVRRHWSTESIYVQSTGGLHISPRPKVGPKAFAVVLFLPLEGDAISRYEQAHSVSFPAGFRDILGLLNGAFIFELSFFGIPPTMVTGGLDRSVLQPHDVCTANRHWRAPYNVPDDRFHIGGGPFSNDENVGYFLQKNGSVESYRHGGQIVCAWPDYESFLTAEIARSETMYPDYEAFRESQ